ncbi:type II toxin-antitoxin system HicA family toxin [Mycobacterium malmoense]|uniref:type II toxin-antitoxin system HicA family toxin n=1 Tax=Mycobacterium malmoense TaxID=1780 RepID=UPI0009F948C6|nr:type II toxin-antitoxin system HicA family toxin [Mycobacterium malmoense]
MTKAENTRDMVKRLKNAGFERISTDGRHSKYRHPSGVRITVPDSHRTISPGVVRKIDNAITEAQERGQ